jgi:hypothetical protein
MPLPPHFKAKGHPRLGGRVKGTPNRISVDGKVLATQLVNSPTYQERLRRDFDRRKLHPAIEAMLWHYSHGKPVQPVLHAGSIDTTHRLATEREAFAQLPLTDLEQLAAESQGLVNRALQLARTAAGEAATPQDVVEETENTGEPLENIKDLP